MTTHEVTRTNDTCHSHVPHGPAPGGGRERLINMGLRGVSGHAAVLAAPELMKTEPSSAIIRVSCARFLRRRLLGASSPRVSVAKCIARTQTCRPAVPADGARRADCFFTAMPCRARPFGAADWTTPQVRPVESRRQRPRKIRDRVRLINCKYVGN